MKTALFILIIGVIAWMTYDAIYKNKTNDEHSKLVNEFDLKDKWYFFPC
ncbi:hypothetical protein [Labilibaculum manganireducens]|nr:hypothetical protein [Labilibaculum manganireducens]